MLGELGVIGRLTLEDEHGRHVHMGGVTLQVQEGGVQAGQAVGRWHRAILVVGRPAVKPLLAGA